MPLTSSFRRLPLLCLIMVANTQASDEVITLSGNFGSFIQLGATVEEVTELTPSRVEPSVPEDERVTSFWYYFDAHAIRVRVCSDDQSVGAINAGATPVTSKYVTEAGVRIGDDLGAVSEAYGDRLQLMPESEGTIWFVDDVRSRNRLTFGFAESGSMRWVALGALRTNGWTCGKD